MLDSARQKLYVSNVNGGIAEQDGNGSIGMISLNTSAHTVDWITGLHSPKGMVLQGNLLYIADVGQVVVADVSNGKIVVTYNIPQSKVLNGISVNPHDGAIYVSDWLGGGIYRIIGQKVEQWIAAGTLPSPNGVQVVGDFLYVALWGSEPGEDFKTISSGYLTRFNLDTATEERIPTEVKWMNPDGLHVIWKPHKRILVTDFIKGVLLDIDPLSGKVKEISLAFGAADFDFDEKLDVAYVPLLMDGQILSVKLNDN